MNGNNNESSGIELIIFGIFMCAFKYGFLIGLFFIAGGAQKMYSHKKEHEAKYKIQEPKDPYEGPRKYLREHVNNTKTVDEVIRFLTYDLGKREMQVHLTPVSLANSFWVYEYVRETYQFWNLVSLAMNVYYDDVNKRYVGYTHDWKYELYEINERCKITKKLIFYSEKNMCESARKAREKFIENHKNEKSNYYWLY